MRGYTKTTRLSVSRMLIYLISSLAEKIAFKFLGLTSIWRRQETGPWLYFWKSNNFD